MADSIKIKILNNEIELDDECWCCEGSSCTPSESWRNEDGTCQICNGTGFKLTGQGQAIIDLVARHIFKRN